MANKVSPKIVSLVFGVLIALLAAGFYIFAWQEPSQTAPEGNVATPINTGNQPQSKSGSISAPIFYDSQESSYYLNPDGNSKLGGDLFVGGNFPGVSFFGDGSDGNVIISTTTSITRGMFYNNLTIESGATLKVLEGVIFVRGSLINRGTITTAAGEYLSHFFPSSEAFGPRPGVGGMAGYATPRNGELSFCGGEGGKGGGTDSNPLAGGPGGYNWSDCPLFRQPNSILINKTKTMGSGGGAGWCANNGTNCYSYCKPGAGGHGGGGIIIFAKNINNASGIIQANGTNGGNAFCDPGNSMSESGGGGGGGGAIILIYNTAAWGIEQVLGGKGGQGIGEGVAGTNGSAGIVLKIANQ